MQPLRQPHSYRGYFEEFSETRLPLLLPLPDHAPNLEPRDNIFPTEPAPVLLPIDGGLALKELRWGLIPWLHKKTVKGMEGADDERAQRGHHHDLQLQSAFARRRCLIPVSNFYEWTGEKGHKTKWSFRLEGAEWFWLAGIWDRAYTADGDIESFALVTLPPPPAPDSC